MKTDKLQPHTLGKRACETTLTQILNENPESIRKVTNLLNEFREGLGYLRTLPSQQSPTYKQISLLWFDEFRRRTDLIQPEVAAKHLHACLKADWRDFLNSKEVPSYEFR